MLAVRQQLGRDVEEHVADALGGGIDVLVGTGLAAWGGNQMVMDEKDFFGDLP